MLNPIHWNETYEEQIFELKKTMAHQSMKNIVEQERLIGEIACLKKNIQSLQNENEQLKLKHLLCPTECLEPQSDLLWEDQ